MQKTNLLAIAVPDTPNYTKKVRTSTEGLLLSFHWRGGGGLLPKKEQEFKVSKPEPEIENVKIERVFLGLEEERLFFSLRFGGKGFSQSTFCPMNPEWIRSLLTLLEGNDLYALKGKYCRIDHDFGHIFRIGHILEERWISTSEQV